MLEQTKTTGRNTSKSHKNQEITILHSGLDIPPLAPALLEIHRKNPIPFKFREELKFITI